MECKHKREYYTCKRLRLLKYLMDRGFKPFTTIPEPNNHNMHWWLFKNTPELEKCVDEYFKELKAKQLK